MVFGVGDGLPMLDGVPSAGVLVLADADLVVRGGECPHEQAVRAGHGVASMRMICSGWALVSICSPPQRRAILLDSSLCRAKTICP